MSKQFKVKWGKTTFEVTTDSDSIEELRASLEQLSNVPAARQKLMAKGRLLDTDDKLKALASGSLLMMIGSAQVVEAVQLDPSEADQSQSDSLPIPNGLVNLGNTCWLNSSLKTLACITELREQLILFADNHQKGIKQIYPTTPGGGRSSPPSANEIQLTLQLGLLMKDIQHYRDDTITPLNLLTSVAKCFPQLVTVTKQGTPQQQDVDEFLTLCLPMLERTLIGLPQDLLSLTTQSTLSLAPSEVQAYIKQKQQDLINTKKDHDDISIDMKDDQSNTASTTTTTDTTTATTLVHPNDITAASIEPPVITYETLPKLRCTVNQETLDIRSGVQQAMIESLEKRSTVLQRNAQYERITRLTTLPKYVIVHLQRFQWKSDTQNKAKIIRKVNLNLNLDLYDLATEDTQKYMDGYRKTFQKISEETHALSKPTSSTETTTEKTPATTETKSPEGNKNEMSDSDNTTGTTTTTTTPAATDVDKTTAQATAPPPGKGVSGYYEMISVITHQGRDAESGHYIAWTKSKSDSGSSSNKGSSNGGDSPSGSGSNGASSASSSMSDKDKLPVYSWVKHDDDRISHVEEKDIVNLSGGGDWHTAYICLYKLKDD